MTQEIGDKVVNTYFFVFDSIPDWYKTQEICDRVIMEDHFLIVYCLDKYVTVATENPFLIVYCLDKYVTQKICDEAVDGSLATLKLITDCFVTNKMIKKLFTAL